ncbi:MAG: PIN domain-containing protein [Micromonosporaceae bacterium]|nr:PIN domain-containing protein [Micromonosporaceae bacterium]
MPVILLDACVLFPNYLRDTFLTLAEEELFRPAWSAAILAEVRRNVLAKRQVNPQAFDRTLEVMNAAFPLAMVHGWEPVVPELELPDLDDRHVLAAAIAGGARSVVTFNLGDFPAASLRPHQVDVVHPDTVLLECLDLAPALVLRGLSRQIGRCRRPPMDLQALLVRLDRCGVPNFTDEVRRRVL